MPPDTATNPINWCRKNLFSTWYDTLFTLILGSLCLWAFTNLGVWATTMAQWDVIPANFPLFFVGRFPPNLYGRLWIILGVLCTLSGISWGVVTRGAVKVFTPSVLIGMAISCGMIVTFPLNLSDRLFLIGMIALTAGGAKLGRVVGKTLPLFGKWLSLLWLITFGIVVWLLKGGLGLQEISTNDWGGLILTLLMAVAGIVLSFPIGVLFALGRQSALPVVRLLSIFYIEIIRGLPLIALLFMGQVMIPLFLPPGVRPDRVVRAIISLTLFSSAYLAENVRGGLQGIPPGQIEAAKALGLNPLLTMSLIVLPQALKAVIPVIVGQFISLFQNTSLLAVVGLVELLGISNSILANPKFLGRYAEVYFVIGIIYWGFCYAMSLASRRLEEKLNTSY